MPDTRVQEVGEDGVNIRAEADKNIKKNKYHVWEKNTVENIFTKNTCGCRR